MKPLRKTRPAPWMLAAGAKKRRSKRALELEQYRKRARAVVAELNRYQFHCPVAYALKGVTRRLEQIHHLRGRVGSLLLDESFWLAVSAWGHRWIHNNLEAARKHGWLCQRGQWGKQSS